MKQELNPNVGEFLAIEIVNKWREAYAKNHEGKENEEFISAFFYGKESIQKLLNYENAIGMRIYYGTEINAEGIESNKMILFPVDKDGNDIEIIEENIESKSIGRGGMDSGLPCPPYCP